MSLEFSVGFDFVELFAVTIEKVGLKTIKETLNLLGGWPVTLDAGSWNEANWSWQKMSTDLELVGFPTNYLFEFSINPDLKNSSTRILGVSCSF